jgi:UDP-N-acetylglucosamine 1-carboxyvinyltransferase
MQAGTYLMAGAITGGDVTVTGILPESLGSVVTKLSEAGAQVEEGHDQIRVCAPDRLKAVRVKTMPHPGFPTDLQQPMAAVCTIADGTSVLEESIYENRIGHISQLNRMGAKITLEAGRISVIEGVNELCGTEVEATDLRAGAALVLAGLAAKGETVVRNVHFIDRGYEDLESRLTQLGAHICRATHETQAAKEALNNP